MKRYRRRLYCEVCGCWGPEIETDDLYAPLPLPCEDPGRCEELALSAAHVVEVEEVAS